LHAFPQNRDAAYLYITVDVGPLANWKFNNMESKTRWVLFDAIDDIKYEVGVTKKPVTKDEAAGMGAGAFNMR
jgi:hypothetical protein